MSCRRPYPPEYLTTLIEPLGAVSAPVAERALLVLPNLCAQLSDTEAARWVNCCQRLATCGWRSAESAAAFVQASPFLLRRLDAAGLWHWADHGESLARVSAAAATSFFQSARPFLQQAPAMTVDQWVEDGQWYLRQHPTFAALAETFFEIGPLVYGQYPLASARTWGQLGHDFARLGWRPAGEFLSLSRRLAEQAPGIDLAPAWQQARRMLPQAGPLALKFLGHYPDYVQRFGDAGAGLLRDVVDELLAPRVTDAEGFLDRLGSALVLSPVAECVQALAWCREICAASHAGGLSFLDHLGTLRERLPDGGLQDWIDAGIAVARRHEPAGAAYFTLESATALDNLHALQKRVEFTTVEPVLRLYTHAIMGRRMELATTDALPQDMLRRDDSLPTSDGTTIYVPPRVDDFEGAADNFGAYKVAILHQTGFYESGTFAFDLDECRRWLPELLATPDGNGESSFEGFFASFAEPDLARGLFAIFEDARIDAWIARRYKGIRTDLERLMRHSRRQRPPLHGMPLRQALLEGLLQLSLGAGPGDFEPLSARLLLRRLAPLMAPLRAPGASVYDTAAAVFLAHGLLARIPAGAGMTFPLNAVDLLSALDLELADDADLLDLADLFHAAGQAADRLPSLPGGDAPASGLEPVPYRGTVKPDAVEKKMRLIDLEDTPGHRDGLSPLSPEVLKALLEKDGLDIRSLQRGDVNAATGLFVSNLQGRPAVDGNAAPRELAGDRRDLLRAELPDAGPEPTRLPQTFYYDEWDYLIGDYRRAWCRLREMPLADGGPDFVAHTRRTHAELLAEVKRQFQMLKPVQYRTVKPLTDGETIDLDSAVEALVDRRAGQTLADKVYARRDRHDRSVAAVFLLDMSASTDDRIKDPEEEGEPERRIIDVEKEALVLMAEALEALGDAYAAYGFSGYGRDQVDAFVVKAFDESYDRRVQGRIAAMEPHRSTRMGPVIRHAAAQLGRQDARLKALILLSDGYPQDFDYGQDRKSKEYGLQDTAKALQEARLKRVHTFCITVDPSGHDYLRDMCPDRQYLVIDDMAALPRELPKVYRGLTA